VIATKSTCLLALVLVALITPLGAEPAGQPGTDTDIGNNAASGADAEAFVAWAREAAVTLATVDPGASQADLAPIKAIVGDAQVVLLGQTARDAHEEFQLGCRLVRFLIGKLGFTVLALEENLATSARFNAYLTRGQGDPVALMAGMGGWQTWETEEFLALLKWLRAYNRDAAHKQKVRFYGIDITDPQAAMLDVLAYLDRVDPEYSTYIRMGPVDFGFLKADSWLQLSARYSRMGDAKRYGVDGYLKDMLARLVAKRSEYVALSSEAEYAWVMQEAISVRRANDFFGTGVAGSREETDNIRTTAMVDNLRWVANDAAKGERIVVWAHNIHVSRDYIDVNVPGAPVLTSMYPMGKFLTADMGNKAVSFGFSCNRGEYPDGPLPPAPSSSVDGVLAQVGKPIFVIDLRAAPAAGPVHAWLNTKNAVRGLGGVTRVVPARAYDALVFIDRITPALPTAGARARLGTLDRAKFSTRNIF
jgi:erythromycin esterase